MSVKTDVDSIYKVDKNLEKKVHDVFCGYGLESLYKERAELVRMIGSCPSIDTPLYEASTFKLRYVDRAIAFLISNGPITNLVTDKPPEGSSVVSDQRAEDMRPRGFIRLWDVLQYLMPRSVRERVYLPTVRDLMVDYAETRAVRYQSRFTRYLFRASMGLQTAVVVLQCWGIWLLCYVFLAFMPGWVRKLLGVISKLND